MARHRRHQRIAELLAEQPVRSQHELADLLAADGLEVTQATLSRDLHEMGVWKGPEGYVLPGVDRLPATSGGQALARIVAREVVKIDAGGSIVVLRTRPAHADAVAIEIDRDPPPGALGTIAGDDTVFVAARSAREARTLLEHFETLAGAAEAPARTSTRRKRPERTR